MNRMRFALVVALAAGAVACGGSSEDDGAGDAGVTKAIVAADGGMVTHPDGASIEIPADALETNATITIRRGGTSAAGSAMYLFESGGVGLDPQAAVTVTLPLPQGHTGGASVYWAVSSGADYNALPATVASGKARARVSDFSWGHAGEACSLGAACAPSDDAGQKLYCHEGQSSCASGRRVCTDTGVTSADGTLCATGVCKAGVCELSCNDHNLVEAPAAPVLYFDPELLPTPRGGTVQNGTYYVTAVNSYGTPRGEATHTEVWAVNGTTVQGAHAGVDETARWTATLSTSGDILTLSGSCGFTTQLTVGYRASATEIRVYRSYAGNEWEYVLRKQ